MHKDRRSKVLVAHAFAEDNYDIDRVIGIQNIRVQDPQRLRQLALENLGQGFAGRVAPGSFVVGQRNFGYGHPHVQATTALRETGVSGIVADSFTPGFWRGALVGGFMLVACPGIGHAANDGDWLDIDWQTNRLRIARTGQTLAFRPHTAFEKRLLAAGGIVPLLAQQRQAAGEGRKYP